MTIQTPISIAYGDGIGPEIMEATLKILSAAKANIAPEVIEVGKKMYLAGHASGIPTAAWTSLKRTKVLLKGPITTPQGGGYKSLNVTLRKSLGLYANVRPCVSYFPYVKTRCPTMNVVIVRENEEDTYAGIEYRSTENMYECLKLVSRSGCERIIHYAFEYARKFNRKKVTCFSKDNIMKMTDGLFHRIFNRIACDYPDIQSEHYIVDIGTAILADQPERFDVIVTLNLYGDIISDVAAQIAGSVGLAGSANIGDQMAMFEAIHGSAPDIAGQGLANPSGLLNAAVQMLVHINQPEVANLIENAWLVTLEEGIHTPDIYSSAHSKKKVDTLTFAQAVIARLGRTPAHFMPACYQSGNYTKIACYDEKITVVSHKQLVGVDIFIDNHASFSPADLAAKLSTIQTPLQLTVITSRGLKVWPGEILSQPDMQYCCCRFQSGEDLQALSAINPQIIIRLMEKILALALEIIKIENLYTYDGEVGFSLAQGQ